jgi:hypothetical protein
MTATIRFSADTEMPNVHAGNVDYVENVNNLIDVLDVLKNYYTANDLKLITSIEIK